jgi:glucose/arabinose dehydrogenase
MASRIAAIAVAALLPLLALAQTKPTANAQKANAGVRVESLASLEFPWGMAHLPDGRLLITEKPGRLRIYFDGKLSSPVEGLPAISYRESPSEQGGLLDVAVDPEFAQNRRIYLSYSEEGPPPSPARPADDDPRFGGYLDLKDTRLRGGAVARATLDGNRLSDVQVIWRQEPKVIGRGHFGHRLVFGRDGTLFITSGERMRFDPAQDVKSSLGKVVRINRDGSIPNDNPLRSQKDARGEIWTLGHRNILAAALDPTTGRLWVFEMGPLGGDELNILEPGRNYGWPVVSNGDNYDKSPIPDHPTKPEFQAPVRSWTPVIAPSGALFYDGSLLPWRGNVIVGSLTAKGLVRLQVEGAKVVNEDRVNLDRRVRDVIQARDGAVLVITDEKNGALLRLTPERGER